MSYDIKKKKQVEKESNEPNLCPHNKLLECFNIEFIRGMYITYWNILIIFSYNDLLKISKESK